MNFVLSLLAGVFGAAIGAFVGMAVASALAPVLGISSFEGAAGYFAVFIGGPAGGLIGLVLGVWLVSRRRGSRGVGAFAGRLGIVVIGIVVLAAGGLYASYELRPQLASNGPPPKLEFEIRLPAGSFVPGKIEVNLDTNKNRMPGNLFTGQFRRDGDRPVIVGAVDMHYRVSQRLLALRLQGVPEQIFQIKLASRPAHAKDFSAWQRVDFVDVPGKDQPRRADATDHYDIRYRAVWTGED